MTRAHLHTCAAALLLAAAGSGCSEPKERPEVLVADDDPGESNVAITGVLPEQFECDSVAPPDELRAIVGPHRAVASQFEVPPGLAAPCNYFVPSQDGGVQWSFDIDCRDRALGDGEKLMVRYATDGESQAVRVGKSGIDYRGQALLFIDDDSPCYARVLGPDADKRLAIARMVAGHLDRRTAPTSLRYDRN